LFARNAGYDEDRKPQSEVSRLPPSIQSSENQKRREHYTVKGDVGIQESAFDDNDLSYEQDSKSKLSGCSWLSNETGADGSRKLIQIPFLTIMKNLKTIITNARIYHHSLFAFSNLVISVKVGFKF
jgi:hypothetical protein